MLLNKGKCSPEDMHRAIRLVSEAAELGCVEAQTTFGCFHADGAFGLPRDMNKAVRWFEEAADNGDIDASFNLGVLKLHGQGIPQNKFEAAKHFRVAGEGGHEDAMANLAMMLVKGDGIPRDMQLGAQWLIKAAQKGDYLEDLMNKIATGNLDTESAIKLQEMIEKLRNINKENPFLKPEGDVKITDYPEE